VGLASGAYVLALHPRPGLGPAGLAPVVARRERESAHSQSEKHCKLKEAKHHKHTRASLSKRHRRPEAEVAARHLRKKSVTAPKQDPIPLAQCDVVINV
jgi:hypothetical protein